MRSLRIGVWLYVVIGVAVAAMLFYAVSWTTPLEEMPPPKAPPKSGGDFVKNATRKRFYTSENWSRLVVEEVYIEGEAVRRFKPRPGVYVYETPIHRLSDGFFWERWVYNVTQVGDGEYIITRELYSYVVQGNKTYDSLPLVTVFRLVNDTLIILYDIGTDVEGNETVKEFYIHNYTWYPVSTNCFVVLPAPPFWPYVEAGRTFKVRLAVNGSAPMRSMPDKTYYWRRAAEENFKVEKRLVECKGPSGMCYVVEGRYREESEDWLTGEPRSKYTRQYRYVYYVDLSGVAVEAYRYRVGTLGESLESKLTLVEWR
ncbi:MAG: hypothetical protein QXP31_05020 [Pyrobaculum sp.]